MAEAKTHSQHSTRLECDVIMAGGLTSGVVFPRAISQLKEKYHFRSIGGTSAGAIAAAITAAAELGRRDARQGAKGFAAAESIPGDLEQNLSSLFQPVPQLARLFSFVKGVLKIRLPKGQTGLALLFAALRALLEALYLGAASYGKFALAGLAIWAVGLAPLVAAFYQLNALLLPGWLSVTLAGLVLIAFALLAIAGSLLAGLARDIMRLSRHDYGICSGASQNGAPALINWIDAKLNDAAGLNPQSPDKPLTFGDLAGEDNARSVNLRMMTSNITFGTGEVLPGLGGGEYFFDPNEMRKILPENTVAYMEQGAQTGVSGPGGARLFKLPLGADMPVLLAVRMSLNFPVLFSAVPLYKHVVEKAPAGWEKRLVRLLFSDGGITSNFPIRFFDSLIPSRPTFGIALDDLPENASASHARVYLPMPAGAGRQDHPRRISGLAGFLGAVFNTAREWQDRKLSSMSGFRERVCHVFLSKDEGGLNLDMEPDVIRSLGGLGSRAGALMSGNSDAADPAADMHNFDFSDHQWRRFLISYARIENFLEDAHRSWTGLHGKPGTRAAIKATMRHPASYAGSPQRWRASVFARMDALMTYFEETNIRPVSKDFGPAGNLRQEESAIPDHSAKLQIVPDD